MKKSIVLLFLAALPVWADLRLEPGEKSLRVLDGEKLVTEYRTDWKVPYLFPLVSPTGSVITRHWPTEPDFKGEDQDHPHHRSIWLGHGLVNGADFWSFKDTKEARINHVEFSEKSVQPDGSVRFTADLTWTSEGKTQLLEKRTHIIRKADADTLMIELISELQAAEADVVFGDTKEGMFGLRMDRSLRLKGPEAKSHIINSEGIADQETWGRRGNWIAYYGPDESAKPVVVAMFDHPTSFRYPTWWHVRDYGLVAANPFGIHDFEKNPDTNFGNHTLKKGEKIQFHYGIIVHSGDLKSADLNTRWEKFSKN